MEDKNKLIELLKDIIEIARSQDNKLTIEEVKAYIKDLSLNEAQLEPIFDYLIANKIKIEGYKNNIPTEFHNYNNEESQDIVNHSKEMMNEEVEKEERSIEEIQQEREDAEFLNMYLQNVEYVSSCSKQEEQNLIVRLMEGDDSVKNRLVELNLKKVIDIANTYKGKGISLSDLVQEANVGLIDAIDTYMETCKKDEIDFNHHVEDCIKNALCEAIDDQIETKNLNKRIIDKISNLTENLKELTEELGKKPSVKEASMYLRMNIDEIEDIIRLSNKEDIPIEHHHHNHHMKESKSI